MAFSNLHYRMVVMSKDKESFIFPIPLLLDLCIIVHESWNTHLGIYYNITYCEGLFLLQGGSIYGSSTRERAERAL